MEIVQLFFIIRKLYDHYTRNIKKSRSYIMFLLTKKLIYYKEKVCYYDTYNY